MGVLRSFLLFIVVSAQLVQAAPVGVSVTGDAEGDLLALSVAGNARTHEGVSVALLGDAANGDDGSGSCQAGHDLGARCIAVSGTGDASNAGDGAASCGAHKYGTTRYAGIGSASCIAVAPAGAASNGGHGEGSCGGNGALTTQCVALAGGDASNGGDGGRSCFLGGVGRCVAASLWGRAANGGDGDVSCFWGGSPQCVAFSATGDASNGGDGVGSCASGNLPSVGCIAASPTGTASNGGSAPGSCRGAIATCLSADERGPRAGSSCGSVAACTDTGAPLLLAQCGVDAPATTHCELDGATSEATSCFVLANEPGYVGTLELNETWVGGWWSWRVDVHADGTRRSSYQSEGITWSAQEKIELFSYDLGTSTPGGQGAAVIKLYAPTTSIWSGGSHCYRW